MIDFLRPLQFVSGDLFRNEHGVRAFAHGCNCQGSMGAGIAKTFRADYPEMYEEYRRRCKADPREFNLGDCWPTLRAGWGPRCSFVPPSSMIDAGGVA